MPRPEPAGRTSPEPPARRLPVSGRTRTFAVLGRPIAHSDSPRLHNAWLAALGVDATYVALDVPPERAAEVPAAMRTLGLAGANLTVPLKEAVLPHLDHLAPSARAAGAANVVVRREGRLVGHNTDGSGLVAHLRRIGTALDRPTAVLGAGGAGRAVVAALLAAGSPRVHLLNRTVDRARRVADQLGDRVRPGSLTPTHLHAIGPTLGLVVQATSGAARAAIDALDPTAVPPGSTWVDLNYWDPDPPHRTALSSGGVHFDDGWGMLVAQAAEAFTLFTGLPLSLERAHAWVQSAPTPERTP